MDIFIKNGILALANVIELDPNGWFQGHIGASFLAGSALLKSNALSKESSHSLKARLDQQAEKYHDLLVPLVRHIMTTVFICNFLNIRISWE
ncbi:hypothetical protein PSI23_02570 [Xenorhabdus sp. XENO-10]|uniref:Uncharacterized protein n=1 Tax=Xenorhabdus yunnanensis TaxID=3025878 RepID=A0ABT5LCJ4_9GAMM|nr:hypothetical protein [Xenorhabdus yunnanensis]MDC9588226.1 hypothetical protein [Xenorhabdus yunnanensis]